MKPAAFAFYLPQYHPVSLNSEVWGEGYTEWNAVLAMHRGFRSPGGTTIGPGLLGFYDLRSSDVRAAQAELARQARLDAFCVYHYYSAGQRVLQEVEDAIIEENQPDFPFFLCWANHDWTMAWRGKPSDTILEQRYDEHDTDEHIELLLAAFEDERYFTIGRAPVLAIFQPHDVPRAQSLFARWRELARSRGHSGLVILGMTRDPQPPDPSLLGLDAWVQRMGASVGKTARWRRILWAVRSPGNAWRMVRYQDQPLPAATIVQALQEEHRNSTHPMVPVVLTSFNNVGRRPSRAGYLVGMTPEAFEDALRFAVTAAPAVAGPDGTSRSLVAINAWNEWGEGMALEPSAEHGDALLRACARVLGGSD